MCFRKDCRVVGDTQNTPGKTPQGKCLNYRAVTADLNVRHYYKVNWSKCRALKTQKADKWRKRQLEAKLIDTQAIKVSRMRTRNSFQTPLRQNKFSHLQLLQSYPYNNQCRCRVGYGKGGNLTEAGFFINLLWTIWMNFDETKSEWVYTNLWHNNLNI